MSFISIQFSFNSSSREFTRGANSLLWVYCQNFHFAPFYRVNMCLILRKTCNHLKLKLGGSCQGENNIETYIWQLQNYIFLQKVVTRNYGFNITGNGEFQFITQRFVLHRRYNRNNQVSIVKVFMYHTSNFVPHFAAF